MTVTDSGILEAIRRKLADEAAVVGERRWSDLELIGTLRAGLRELYQVRPSAFSVSALVADYDDVTEPEAAGDTLPVRAAFVEPLANYAAGTLLMDDSDRADPERGARFLQLWGMAL